MKIATLCLTLTLLVSPVNAVVRGSKKSSLRRRVQTGDVFDDSPQQPLPPDSPPAPEETEGDGLPSPLQPPPSAEEESTAEPTEGVEDPPAIVGGDVVEGSALPKDDAQPESTAPVTEDLPATGDVVEGSALPKDDTAPQPKEEDPAPGDVPKDVDDDDESDTAPQPKEEDTPAPKVDPKEDPKKEDPKKEDTKKVKKDKLKKTCKKRPKEEKKSKAPTSAPAPTLQPKVTKAPSAEPTMSPTTLEEGIYEANLPYCDETLATRGVTAVGNCEELNEGVLPDESKLVRGHMVIEMTPHTDTAVSDMHHILEKETTFEAVGCGTGRRRRLQQDNVSMMAVEIGELLPMRENCTFVADVEGCEAMVSDVVIYYQGDADRDQKSGMLLHVKQTIEQQVAEGDFRESDVHYINTFEGVSGRSGTPAGAKGGISVGVLAFGAMLVAGIWGYRKYGREGVKEGVKNVPHKMKEFGGRGVEKVRGMGSGAMERMRSIRGGRNGAITPDAPGSNDNPSNVTTNFTHVFGSFFGDGQRK